MYRQNVTFTANKIRAQCAMTLMMENIIIDRSNTRPLMKTAADNFGSCHIKMSSTATTKSIHSFLLTSHTVYQLLTKNFFLLQLHISALTKDQHKKK